jgi:hypothetical protein
MKGLGFNTILSISFSYTANEGLVKIQHECLVPIYVFPEMKPQNLIFSNTDL